MTVNGVSVNAHASVEDAWAVSEGEGIVIAVIDDGVDIDHEEFASPGKIVAPLNASAPANSPNRFNPRPAPGNNHGTACAGVACADGRLGASGVAPKARLMPIRLASALGSQAEADAFVHAAQAGADVISCSWGPTDGDWFNPNDPRHFQDVPVPDSTRLAIDFAISNGRGGAGCVIVWAAGNGREDVGNDGYARSDKVIAVAACNDRGTRSVYSDEGDAIWCAFPSNDFAFALFGNPPPLTTGIWTTDRSGADGYNPGQAALGDAAGDYTNEFGGTSSACPGAAGVAALVLARNPSLRWDEAKDVLRRSCDRVDPGGGEYDANGHSPFFGFGRLNAKTAVGLAQPAQPAYTARHTAVRDVAITDLATSEIAVEVGDTAPIHDLAVTVTIDHTFVGDLIVTIHGPGGSAVLHNRAGGETNNLSQRYDQNNAPGLAALVGTNPQGTWTLEVSDNARRDVGAICSFSVELIY
jgi:subtilisin family serine protease